MNGKGMKNLADVKELDGEVMAGGAVGPTHQDPSRFTHLACSLPVRILPDLLSGLLPFTPISPSVSCALHFLLRRQHEIPTCLL